MYKNMDRVTVAEAAVRLGVKEQAVRKRIHRGTLLHDKDDDGRVYVYLDPEDESTGMGKGTSSSDTSMSTLVQILQEQIVYLRQEAEDWKEEAKRKDTIIMSLTQHIPKLGAPAESHEASEAGKQGANKGGGSTLLEQREQRSWLYRFFFGP
jgi:hypothetical protein